ncbi:hypothetical protein INT45_008464 [Circinella minor]|uniref:Uncharacterized protein n=1 Tax=Circinella minor TaxID=1195481 RepID=A0A8H7SEP8_9FUNG|nr:hypothetical protein INT45_008464 [Circinella minor]
MESHMLPSSPTKLKVAVHINVMESYIRQQSLQHQSVTSIAKVVAKEFPPDGLSGQRKGNARGLNETGVFGSTCARHGFPLFFMSMHGGESLLYQSYVYPLSIYINQIKQRYGTNLAVFFYDVACQLKPSLIQTFEDLKDVPMAVPVFHAYSHGAMQSGLRGFGQQLDLFSPQTKHSGPNKRKLTLTCAFNALKDEKVENIGRVLKTKFSRANIVKNEAEKALENYSMDRLKGTVGGFFLSSRQAEIPSQDSNFNETKETLRNA